MSLSINPSSTTSCSDGPAASAAGQKSDPSGLPFDSILDEQTDANNQETDEISDADLAPGRQATDPGAVTTQASLDSPAGPRGFGDGSRRRVPGKDALNQDAASVRLTGKDKTANDAATLLLLAAQDLLQRIDSLTTAAPTGHTDSVPAKTPTGPAGDDELQQGLLAALVDIAAEAARTEDAPGASLSAASESSSPVTEFLIQESTEAAQADQARGSEVPLSRPASLAPGVVLADAIRFAIGQGTPGDQDKGFNQSSAGFDRRNSRSAAPAIQVAEAVSTVDSTVKAFAAPDVAAAARVPDEKDVVSSIVQSMRLQMRDGVGTAVVHLEPDYLGAVSISLRVDNGVVSASLHAENPQVRAWMEANAPLLRESLSDQGLSLDRLLITDERIADEQSAGRRQQQEQEQRARQRPRRDQSTTFEVVV